MKVLMLCLAASLAIGGSASAAERGGGHSGACETLGALKAGLKGAKFTTLNAGQFHFIEGAYVAVPPPSGLPPADGAVLVQIKDKSLILWMSGHCAAKENPMPISDRIVQALGMISPANGEIAEPDDSSEERKL